MNKFLAVSAIVLLGCGTLAWAADTKPASDYPLDTCVVSGKKLGDMGAPVIVQVKGREVRLCCPGCKSKLEANPDEYLKKLDKAIIDKQKPNYPLDTCVVLGKKLDANAVDYIYQNRLVRLCCKDCIAAFEKDPAKYLAKIDEAAKKTPKK